ncbi:MULTISPECIES: conjugal transfer protein [unclassified Streptomyces]|uniref:conjugal transfer protein n=1 Tax=unclassified Streptomyces TaxID=2593676 RepID=UPI00324C67EC
MDLWLRADAATPDSSVAAAVRALAPQVELPKRPPSTDAASLPARVVAVRSSVSAGTWTVVVAAIRDQAEPIPAGGAAAGLPLVRYFAVSGRGGPDNVPVTVAGVPAEVAAPDAPPVSAAQFTHRVAAGAALETSLGEFVRAYLSGGPGGGLERYLSPGLRVSAPKTAPYVRIDVSEVVADTEAATAATVPADGVKAQVQIRVTGEDRNGVRWPLSYRAEVTARTGRWEVSGLEAGMTSPPTSTVSSPAAVPGGAR